MSSNCIHPNNCIILDEHEGTTICTNCSHVLDTFMPMQTYNTRTDNSSHDTNSILDVIVTNNNINYVIHKEAMSIFKNLSKLKIKKDPLHLSLYAIYVSSIITGNPYTIEELAIMSNKSLKDINRIINVLSKQTNYKYLITEEIYHPKMFISRYCASFLTATEIHKIKKIPIPKSLLSKHPRLVIAGIVNYYFDKNNIVFLNSELCINVIKKNLNVKRNQILDVTNEIKLHNNY